jgi:phosphate transport system ATP-binding protein
MIMKDVVSTDKVITKGLNLFYGEKQILKNVNITIPEKKVTAIIGPSGCGKSTFLRCINRMNELNPASRVEGEILIDGKNIYADEVDPVEVRQKIGMVFQRPNPFPKSVFENVVYGLKIKGMRDKKNNSGIVERSLQDSGLWDEVKDRLNDSALSLSGGQQQRLCIARALAIEPEIILMDEPSSALDPASTLKIEELMDELKKQYTIILVTHNMQQAARASDYTGFLYLGELIEFDVTNRIFTKPREKLTENYITGRFG